MFKLTHDGRFGDEIVHCLWTGTLLLWKMQEEKQKKKEQKAF